MNLTDVRLMKSKLPGMSKAFGQVVFENDLCVSVSILDTGNGPFVAWPARQDKEKKWVKQVAFKTNESKMAVDRVILEKFATLGNTEDQSQPEASAAPSAPARRKAPF